jgi:hypothetical protein
MTTEQKVIRAKVGLVKLAKQLGNVSQACKVMGYSRDSFYRFALPFTRWSGLRGEAGSDSVNGEIACRSCGGPMPGRVGQSALKYFHLREAVHCTG